MKLSILQTIWFYYSLLSMDFPDEILFDHFFPFLKMLRRIFQLSTRSLSKIITTVLKSSTIFAIISHRRHDMNAVLSRQSCPTVCDPMDLIRMLLPKKEKEHGTLEHGEKNPSLKDRRVDADGH